MSQTLPTCIAQLRRGALRGERHVSPDDPPCPRGGSRARAHPTLLPVSSRAMNPVALSWLRLLMRRPSPASAGNAQAFWFFLTMGMTARLATAFTLIRHDDE